MKKTLLFAFVWLTLTVLWGGGLLFAGGGGDKNKAGQARVADVADVAEVTDQEYPVRRNPAVQVAGGNVYALPAEPLNPEQERLPPPVYAISGVRGVEITETSPLAVDIIVNLPEKEKFAKGILEGTPVNHWIEDLPEGLEAKAHGVKKGATTVKIFISGTPERTARTYIQVKIPGDLLEGGSDQLFKSPTAEESLESWQKSQTE
jgi:hypothetical protein